MNVVLFTTFGFLTLRERTRSVQQTYELLNAAITACQKEGEKRLNTFRIVFLGTGVMSGRKCRRTDKSVVVRDSIVDGRLQ